MRSMPGRVAMLFSMCAACAVPCPAAERFRFADAGSFAIGPKPAGIALVDLDHDGRVDVLAANDGPSTVSVALGLGDMQMTPPVAYPSAPSGREMHHPHPLATGDFNGDGHVDYAVTSQYGGPFYVSVALGTGNGQFLSQVIYTVGACPTSVSAIDTNHDGVLDLVVTNYEGNDISVLLGNGNGTFQAQQRFPASPRPVSNVMADFNGDGHVDVAVVDWVDDVKSIMQGLGDGRFGPPVGFAAGMTPRSLVAGDFNRDGIVDVAVANSASDSVSVLRGYGDGTFAPAIEYPLYDVPWLPSSPNSIAAVDLDRDGNLDLVVADFGRNAIEILRGNPNGIFDAAQVVATLPQPTTVAAADFNRDGAPDLALLHYDTGRVGLLVNDGIFEGLFE